MSNAIMMPNKIRQFLLSLPALNEISNYSYMKKLLSLFILTVVCTATMFGQLLSPVEPLQKDSTVIYGKLDNGLTYYIKHNDKPAQRADFYIVTNVGAIQETPAQDGLAHFLEHMCLNGTKNFPGKGIISYMESIGAKFGENINASTGVEHTSYMLNNIPVTREGIIDSSLLILHDYSAYVTNDFDEIDNERGVILEEKRTRNTAQWRMRDAAMAALFKGSKYATCSLIGSEENLKNFDPNFYKTWYRPDLQAIVVVGDIDAQSVEKKIQTLFGQIPAAENPKAKETIKVPANEKPIVSIFTDKEIPQTSVEIHFKSEPVPAEIKGLGMGLMVDLSKDLISAMLNERLQDIYTKPDAPFLAAGAGFAPLATILDSFYGAVNSKDGEAIPAFEAFYTELERARRYGFNADEFDRAKTQIISLYENNAAGESGRRNEEIVQDYISNFTEGEPYTSAKYLYDVVKGYFDNGLVTLEMVNQIFPSVVTDTNVVILYNAPEREGLATPAEQDFIDVLDRVKAADIAPLASSAVMEPLLDTAALKGTAVTESTAEKFGVTRLVLGNGIEVYVKPTTFKEDEILIKTQAGGGKTLLSEDMLVSCDQSLVSMFSASGYGGISKFPATTLQKMLTGKNVTCIPYIRQLAHGVEATTTPKDLETALQLIYLSYTAPRIEEQELNVPLNMLKSLLANYSTDPNFIFRQKFNSLIYDNSPRMQTLDSATVKNVSIAKYGEAYRQLFSDAGGLKVYIIGNVDIDGLKPLVEKYFGSLPASGEITEYNIDNVPCYAAGKVTEKTEVDMSTPKTTVGILYNAKMEKSLENDILASALTHILDMTYVKSIREEEGGTYGVSAMTGVSETTKQVSTVIVFDTDPAKADELIALAKQEYEAIAENGTLEEYVEKARTALIKAFPEKQISNSYWQSVINDYVFYGYDSHSNYMETVEKCVNNDNIAKFAKKTLKGGNMRELIMNPAK